MKSKAYILRQIKDLLIDNRAYTVERADERIEEIKDMKVYELLVMKNELSSSVELPDLSFISNVRRY
ncbi:hypothetical protein [Dishui Lake phycodnavirus 3]|nr:hypothetical protein [Dishui Lake phycodnavirus 3]